MDSRTDQGEGDLHKLLAGAFRIYTGRRVDFAIGKLAVAIDRVPETLFRAIRTGRMTLELAQELIRHSQLLVETHPEYQGDSPLTFEDLKPYVVDPDCLP